VWFLAIPSAGAGVLTITSAGFLTIRDRAAGLGAGDRWRRRRSPDGPALGDRLYAPSSHRTRQLLVWPNSVFQRSEPSSACLCAMHFMVEIWMGVERSSDL